MRSEKKVFVSVVLVVTAAVGAIWFWPASSPQAGYPFARRLLGDRSDPLWRVSPEALDKLTSDDAERLEQFTVALDRALTNARAKQALLATTDVEKLGSQDRKTIRELWWGFFEPMVALDRLKERYEGWYGIDYVNHAGLHSRAYGLSYAALCAQVAAGQAWLDLVAGKNLAQKLFDEEMPELGLPRGTFSAMRMTLGRARDYSFVPAGSEWFEQWIEKHLSGTCGDRIKTLVRARKDQAIAQLIAAKAAMKSAENKQEVLKSAAFKAWFPVQKEVAEWAGDTRVAPEGRRLISDAQLVELKKQLRPGDIIVERRNWYISNVGLPGFWPHAALYAGSQDDIRRAFDQNDEVKKKYGVFSEYLAKTRSAGWKALGEKDPSGHPHVIIEAISEGVVAASLEHSCGADYVAALRPTLPEVDVATAIDRALSYLGRPYDFDFDFATDDRIVCSELVIKAYEPADATVRGIRAPWITVAGRRAVPPTELVRLFAEDLPKKPQGVLEFVYFLDGREETKNAVVADARALAQSVDRPKWDVAQP
jgi:hypothetical protein